VPDRYPVRLEHEELLVRRGRRSGLYSVVAVHSTGRGPALGGCRMWTYDDTRDAVRDALRLARGMTYKSAVAGLRLGGGKGVIVLPGGSGPVAPPTGRSRHDVLRDFGETVDVLQGRYVTAEDVGTATRDMVAISETTPHVTGLPRARGGSGDPSPFTALGVEAAVIATAERAFGSAALKGRSVAVIGLGHVGLPLARRLARRGAKLVVADIDEAKKEAAAALGARWMTPDKALLAPVDVLVPSALGGVLDHESVPRLQAQAIAGAANNQLADDGVADLLHARGILWAPDFVANAGGIINISVELEPGGYDPGRARERVRAIGDTLRDVYDRAAAGGMTPLTAAMELARSRLADPSSPA
jgi:leucine dehydrogenase